MLHKKDKNQKRDCDGSDFQHKHYRKFDTIKSKVRVDECVVAVVHVCNIVMENE
jgi:hypothetical protein